MTRITKYVDALVTKTDTLGDGPSNCRQRTKMISGAAQFLLSIWRACLKFKYESWLEQSVRDGAVTGQFGFYGLEEISVWASLEDERLLHALPHTLSFFILFLLFYTVAVSCSNMFIYVLEEDLRRFQRGDHEIACPLLILFFYTAFILFILLHFYSQICTIVQSWAGRAPSGPL